ncbi:MAG: agmatinase [Candidatus Thorarchaeota archaeon]
MINTNSSPYFFGSLVKTIDEANLCTIGLKWDDSASFRKGAKNAPDSIRNATTNLLYNYFTESGTNIKDKWKIFDYGNIELNGRDAEIARNNVYTSVREIYSSQRKYLFLGGDHLITYFTFWSLYHISGKRLGLLYLDAHPDLYEQYDGNKYSHACVVSRIIQEANIDPKTILEIGIRAHTPEQLSSAHRQGIKIISSKGLHEHGPKKVAEIVKNEFSKSLDGIYLSIDMDLLDPAYAPGVSNPEPGGLSTRELIDFIQYLSGLNIIAFDLVEHNPQFDTSNITAYSSAKIIKEVLGIL